MNKTFMNKDNRNALWSTLSKEQKAKHRRTSYKNQRLHPMYVDDYEVETGIKLSRAQKGFGNTIYKTHFPVIYVIVEKVF